MNSEEILLELEELTSSHAPKLFQGLRDRQLYTFLDEDPPVSVEALTTRYAYLEMRASPDGQERWLNWAVRIRNSKIYIGYVQATVGADGEAKIAYVIFSDFWGRGLGRIAVSLMLDRLRDHFDVSCATARVDAKNDRSIRLLASLHFSAGEKRDSTDVIFRRLLA